MSSSTLAAGPLLFSGIALGADRDQAAVRSNAPRRDYRKCFRRLVLDMHVADWGPHLMAKFDPAAIADTLRQAHVEQAMAYAKSALGLCYWPTKIGTRHAALKGRDLFGEFVRQLRSRDILACAYYSVVFDNAAIRRHPECRCVGRPGHSYEDDYSGNRYGLACPNQPGYHKQIMAEVEELVRGYEFDVMFFDMAFWRTPCFCDACQRRCRDEGLYDGPPSPSIVSNPAGSTASEGHRTDLKTRSETDAAIPEAIDWNSESWCRYQTVRERWTGEFMQQLTDLVKRIRPGLPVYHNVAGVLSDWRMGVSFEHAVHSDFLGGDFYGDPVEQLTAVKLFTNLSTDRPIEFMTSRGDPTVKEHVNNKSYDDLEMAALAAVSQHAAFTLIDSINVDGTVDAGVYRRIGRVNQQIAPYESELGGEPVEDIAVYFSSESKVRFDQNGQPLIGAQSDKLYPHLLAVRGACQKLQWAHRPFGVITRKQLPTLVRYKVVILPDVLRMDRDEVEAFSRYVQDGGRLYASRWTSLTETRGRRHADFMLANVFGCHFRSAETGQVNFLNPAAPVAREALEGQAYLSHANDASSGTGTLYLSEQAEGKVLGTLTKAYFQVPGNVVDNKLESLHTTPPARDTGQPMLVHHAFGEGQSVYCAANLEAGATEAHRSLFLALIELLRNGWWSFEVDAHPAVWATVFDQPNRRRLVLSLLNYQAQLPPVPIRRVPFVLQPPKGTRFKRLVRLPRPEDIAFELGEDGALRAEVRDLDKLGMVAAEYASRG